MKVEIKSWEEMKAEFGLDDRGSINTLYGYTQQMEDELPQDRIIEIDSYSLWYTETTGNFWGWSISKDMIKGVVE